MSGGVNHQFTNELQITKRPETKGYWSVRRLLIDWSKKVDLTVEEPEFDKYSNGRKLSVILNAQLRDVKGDFINWLRWVGAHQAGVVGLWGGGQLEGSEEIISGETFSKLFHHYTTSIIVTINPVTDPTSRPNTAGIHSTLFCKVRNQQHFFNQHRNILKRSEWPLWTF